MSTRLRAPFPYFGSKYDIASEVWQALGEPANYVEPFAGSLAVLLSRPTPGKVETVNDYNGLVVNFWRAVQADPEQVAAHADDPVHEASLHAWHRRLVESAGDLREQLLVDPEYSDPRLAGRWAWGASAWLGSGWCDPRGVCAKRPQLAGAGTGDGRHASTGHGVHRNLAVHQTRPHLSTTGVGVHRLTQQLPSLQGCDGSGVGYGRGVHQRAGRQSDGLVAWMLALAERLRFVRVCCGDFARVLTPAVTTLHGLTGVFLDPPYDLSRRSKRIYASEDAAGTPHEETVAQRAAQWAISNGHDPDLRIVLAGLEGEHDMPATWRVIEWKTGGGYGNQTEAGRGRANAKAERLWCSPHCLAPDATRQMDLLGGTGS